MSQIYFTLFTFLHLKNTIYTNKNFKTVVENQRSNIYQNINNKQFSKN